MERTKTHFCPPPPPELCHFALAQVNREFLSGGFGAFSSIFGQVHDELILESPLAEAEEAGARVRELMTGAAELSVPLVAEVRAGGNWDEAH